MVVSPGHKRFAQHCSCADFEKALPFPVEPLTSTVRGSKLRTLRYADCVTHNAQPGAAMDHLFRYGSMVGGVQFAVHAIQMSERRSMALLQIPNANHSTIPCP